MRHTITQLLKSNYSVYRTYRTLRWRIEHPVGRVNPVLVFQMGKVGSTSVAAALSSALPHRAVYHVHGLSPRSISIADQTYRAHSRVSPTIDSAYIRSRVVSSRLRKMRRRGRIDFVTLVRDPGARNFSAFFQELRLSNPSLDERLRHEELSDELISATRQLFQERAWIDDPFSWFTYELLPTTGINVFSAPFSRENGYAIYQNTTSRVLLLRFEDLEHCFTNAVADFFGIHGVELPRLNISGDKHYAEAQRQLARGHPFSQSALDQMYESQLLKHFYSESETAEFRARWQPSEVDPNSE